MIYGYIKNVPNDTPPPTPSAGGWSRPIEWLKQPVINDENVVWCLVAVFLGNENPFTHNCHATGGVTTEFYDDVMSPTPFATYTTNNDIFIDWDDCTATEHNGYRMCWAKITPVNPSNNFTTIDFLNPHSTLGVYASQILEMLVSQKTTSPSLSTNHRLGGGGAHPFMLENVEYFNKVVIGTASLYGYGYYAKALQNVKCHTPTVIGYIVREMFSGGCSLVTPPINAQFAPSFSMYFFQYNGMLSFIDVDFSSSVDGLGDSMRGANASYINCTNMGSVTESLGIIGSQSTKRIILDDFKQSFNVSQAGIIGEAQFMELAQSLGVTTTGTITITTAQYNSFGGFGSPVDDELFNKGWLVSTI